MLTDTIIPSNSILYTKPRHDYGGRGEDTTWYLADYNNWTNSQVHSAFAEPNYQMTVESWIDQRNYLYSALALLQSNKSQQVYQQLGEAISKQLDAIEPVLPDAPSLTAEGFHQVPGNPIQQSEVQFTCHGWTLQFGTDASITKLTSSSGHTVGQSLGNPKAGFGRYTYQTLSPDDFTKFDKDYGLLPLST